MTTLGLIILVCFVGLFVYGGIRLLPVYLEDRKIAGAFESVEEEFTGSEARKRDIYNAMYKRFDVNSVRVVTAKDVVISKVDGGYDVEIDYENRVPFIANVSFVVDFKHKTTIIL
ncbi:MAG: DUF4845 domain-containing protein [Pseudomonadota bacterium]